MIFVEGWLQWVGAGRATRGWPVPGNVFLVLRGVSQKIQEIGFSPLSFEMICGLVQHHRKLWHKSTQTLLRH